MFIKFLKDEKSYEFTSGGYNIDAEKVKFKSNTIPATAGGFTVINDDGIEVDYSQYKVPYEKTDSYIIFTSDTAVYYTYFVYDAESKFVTSQVTTTADTYENGILRKSGQGKAYSEPSQEQILDADGFYMYKMADNQIIRTTTDEKAAWEKERKADRLESALAAKISEISTACSSAIMFGVDYDNKHFSYDNDDQKNISNAVQLVVATGLGVPYHADGESCEIYSKEDVIAIYVAEETNLTHNVTYHNQLKLYVQTLSTVEEIEAVKYGETELVGQYKTTYDTMMAQAQEVIKKFIGES